MNFSETPEFAKEFKHLFKKFKSLSDDLSNFKRVIPQVSFKDNKNFAIISQTETWKIVKGRLFCKYLKKNSLRIIFAYNKNTQQAEFIEIYFKGDKENEDRKRIEEYLIDLK